MAFPTSLIGFIASLLVVSLVCISWVECQPVGRCHHLVLKSNSGSTRIFNLDALSSLKDPLTISIPETGDLYAFRVCSDLQCGYRGPTVGACLLSKGSAYRPVSGPYPEPMAAEFTTTSVYGSIQFTLRSFCTATECVTAKVRVDCDPKALAQSSAITDTSACFQNVLDRTPQNLTVIAPKPFLNPYYQFSLSHVSACGEGFVKPTPPPPPPPTPPPVGQCHNMLVTDKITGEQRMVNLDALSSLPNPFYYTQPFQWRTMNFRVCSNVTCNGTSAAACLGQPANKTQPDGPYAHWSAGTYYYPLNATLISSNDKYPLGAVRFVTDKVCDAQGCRYSTVTIVCDPSQTKPDGMKIEWPSGFPIFPGQGEWAFQINHASACGQGFPGGSI